MIKHISLLFMTLASISPAPKHATTNPPVPKKHLPAAHDAVTVYTTADGTDYRITKTGTLTFKPAVQPTETEPFIYVNPGKTYQQFLGIGGALTDAAAETFAKLPKDKQKELITAYYNPEKGIGYTLGRTNIASCDFSSDMYEYIAPNDKALKTFNISHDRKFRIPLIKQAIAEAGGKLTIFASPWSPPAWMKDNNDRLHGGKLKPEFYQSWANHYVKFIQAYQKENIPIWGFTVQNEPMAKQKWESCLFTANDERDFIKVLGPTMVKAGMANKKMIAWDHNRDLMYQRASTILSDPIAAKYVWGIGYHWYETWTGSDMLFGNEKSVADSFPGKSLLFTEGCVEKFDMSRIKDWKLGEKYGRSMINDFNNGTVGWTDWNILLDEQGGPNHVGNFCFSPVHANTATGEILYTNAYYYIGHFSKFIRPGAKRIGTSSSRDKLLTTAFKNVDGSIAVIVLNLSDDKQAYKLIIAGKETEAVSLPHSIATLVI